jgi:hypothetical protein
VNDDEVRMPAVRAYREVVPNDSVLFEEVLEPLRESQFATAVKARETQAGDQNCHVTADRLTRSEPDATSTRFETMLTGLPHALNAMTFCYHPTADKANICAMFMSYQGFRAAGAP